MKFIDFHCDTLMLSYLYGLKDIESMPNAMLDATRLKSTGALAQFLAIFLLPPGIEKMIGRTEPVDDNEYIDYLLNVYKNTLEYGTIASANSVEDILANEKKGQVSTFLTFEDGRIIAGKLDNLKKYYDQGIRLISLTWNQENCFGSPNSTDIEIMKKGLTGFGKEAIPYMNDLGMIVDVSHLSDGGFWDVAELSKKPFIASHSNCRTLSPHQRNLTDEMIKAIGDAGGIIGLNYGAEFLNQDITNKSSRTIEMVEHIKHMIQYGGEDCIALGSDFDGISGDLEISTVDKVPLLFDALRKNGLTESQLEKLAYKNGMRFLNDVL